MSTKKRTVSNGVLNHCYQRTKDRVVIFYSVSDYLVYFTLYCVLATKYGVKVLALAIMPDHIHDSVIVPCLDVLAGFKKELNTRFSKINRLVCHNDDTLFEEPYGSAPKYTEKSIRSNLIYVGNNPVERRLSKKAEEYRWSFVAYAVDDHPFSDKMVLRQARCALRDAVKEVKYCRNNGKPLAYKQLQRMFRRLDKRESQQLVDYIIVQYSVIDYQAAVSYFDSYDNMLLAMHSTTGSEHDIKEESIGRSDAHYFRMTSLLMKHYGLKDIHDILAFDDKRKWEALEYVSKELGVPIKQAAAFLRIKSITSPKRS